MSKNKNRVTTKCCTQNRWYNIANFKWKNDPWDDYGWNFHHGDMENHKWRGYKSWKHNRRTRYK